MARVALLAALLAACGPLGGLPTLQAPPPTPAATASNGACAPTIARQRPPEPVVEFLRAGASPQPSYEQFVASFAHANWAGNDAFWVGLPADGVIRPTFPPARDAGWKLWSYATAPGDPTSPHYGSYPVTASARRLDGPTPAGFVAAFNGASMTGYGPGFLATGLTFPIPGCWEVTYRAGAGAGGTSTFTFVLEVR